MVVSDIINININVYNCKQINYNIYYVYIEIPNIMAIHTFSTKGTKPEDEQIVQDVKKHCEQHCLNFSGLVVTLLRNYKTKAIDDGRPAKV